MADQRTPQQLAESMIPGLPATNWLGGMMRGAERAMNSRPTPQSRAVDARRAAALRRSRLAQQLQNDAARMGRAPLSQNEVDSHLATMGY